MKEYSIPMAVFDLLPVVFFIAGTMTIAGDMKHKMTLPARVLFEGGSWIVCAAGILKALYKLIYSLGLGDLTWMSGQFFYNQAFGFLLAGVGLTLAVTQLDKSQGGLGSGGSGKLHSIVPIPIMALVGIMVVGLAALDEELPDNVQIIGMVIDVPEGDTEMIETAKEICKDNNITYTNI